MVKVYLEDPNGKFADVIATFVDEELYDRCFKAIEQYADEEGLVVTESVEE